jgi:hypothetical protein
MTIDQRIPADRLHELLAAGFSATWPPGVAWELRWSP